MPLLAFFGLSAAALPAQGAEIPGAINKVTVTPTNAGQYDPMTVNVDWSVPSGSKPGDTFSLQLPSQLAALTTSFDLKDEDGDLVANAKVVNGMVVFTLTDYVNNHSQVKGTATFKTHYQTTVVGGEPITLDFGVAGKVTVTPTPLAPVDRTIPAKYGSWIDESGANSMTPTDRIRWVIESPKGPFDTAVFTDDQGVGQKNECGSLFGQVSTGFNPRGEVSGWRPLAAEKLTVASCTDRNFIATIKPVPAGQVVSVSYIVAITDPTLKDYTNTAKVVVDGKTLEVTSEVRRYDSSGDGNGTEITPTPTKTTPTTTTPPVSPETTSSSPTTSSNNVSTTTSVSGSSSPGIAQSSPANGDGNLVNTGAAGVLPLVGIAALIVVTGLALLLIRRRAH